MKDNNQTRPIPDIGDLLHKPAKNFRWTERTLCAALAEMRECYETRNFSYMLGLIEEAQSYANRMEAKLGDYSELKETKEQYKKMKEELNKEGRESKLDKLDRLTDFLNELQDD